jgi:hypothetical protein
VKLMEDIRMIQFIFCFNYGTGILRLSPSPGIKLLG